MIAGVLFVVASAAVLAAVRFLTTTLGLPDWVFPGAVLLLAIGLPIILTTAVLQGFRAKPPTAPATLSGSRPLAHLDRAISGGGLAFSTLGITTAGYMAMRVLGIGPIGTLLASGVLREREPVLLADFQSQTRDTSLGNAVTDAFRIDFAQSPVVTLVPPERIAEVLKRMRRL